MILKSIVNWIAIFLILWLCFIAIWPKFRIHWQRHIWDATASIPGPRKLPIIGNILLFFCSRDKLFQVFRDQSKIYKKRYKLWLVNICAVFLKHPDDIQKLFSNPRQVEKNKWIYNVIMGQLVKNGIVTIDAHFWKPKRKMLSPAFSTVKLKDYLTTSYKWIDYFIESLESEPNNFLSDLEYVNKFTLASACENIMGWKFDTSSSDYQSYKNNLEKCYDIMMYRTLQPWFYIQRLYDITSKGRETKVIKNEFQILANKVIRNRLNDGEKDSNSNEIRKQFCLLDLLLENKINKVDMMDEILTFIIAGNHTTRSIIEYLFLVLANKPKLQERIYEELQDISDDKNHNFEYDDLQKLTFLEMCIKETLRLYPPAPFVLRDLVEELKLDDVTLPAEILCVVNIFDVHRNPDFWPNPDMFDPDRFLPENVAKRHPYAYIPFAAGPRNCIGQRFAMLTIKAFVSKFLRHYWLEPVDNPENLTFVMDMFLRTKEKLHVRMIRRP